jgi:hypothetical protein
MDGNQVSMANLLKKNRLITIAQVKILLLNFYLFMAKRAIGLARLLVWLQNLEIK